MITTSLAEVMRLGTRMVGAPALSDVAAGCCPDDSLAVERDFDVELEQCGLALAHPPVHHLAGGGVPLVPGFLEDQFPLLLERLTASLSAAELLSRLAVGHELDADVGHAFHGIRVDWMQQTVSRSALKVVSEPVSQ